MSVYVTQLEIIRGESKAIVEKLLNSFIIGKCVKKIDRYYHKSYQNSRAAFEIYVYYTTPEQAPTVVVTITDYGVDYINLLVNISSNVYLQLFKTGVVVNKTGNPDINDFKRIITPPVYGSFTVELTQIKPGNTYYIRGYCLSCIGYTYSEQVSQLLIDPILDTHLNPILDTYGEYIFDTY